jgi:hypothetical protein
MSKPSISQLYQTLTAAQTLRARALIDADTALRAAAGRIVPHERDEVATALAGSAAHADLVQFLRALEPASTELAQGLAHGAGAHEIRTHETRERHQRGAHGRRSGERGWQWGAMAACLVAAVALFAARSGQTPMAESGAFAHQSAADTIFDAAMEARIASQTALAGDSIFSAGDAASDRIFHASGG